MSAGATEKVMILLDGNPTRNIIALLDSLCAELDSTEFDDDEITGGEAQELVHKAGTAIARLGAMLADLLKDDSPFAIGGRAWDIEETFEEEEGDES
jgi:hypothetical protein